MQYLLENSTNFRGLPRFHRLRNQHNSKATVPSDHEDEGEENFEDAKWEDKRAKEETLNCSHTISLQEAPELVHGVQRSASTCSGHSVGRPNSPQSSAVSNRNSVKNASINKRSLNQLVDSLDGLEQAAVKRFLRGLERRRGKMVTLDASVVTYAKWRQDILNIEQRSSRLLPNGRSSYFSFFPHAYESDIEENYDDEE